MTEWEKEEIRDLLEEYPNLIEMSNLDLAAKARELRWNAARLYEECNRLDSNAEAIINFMKLREDENDEIKKFINTRDSFSD